MRLMLPNKQRPIDLTINGQEVDFPFTNGFVELWYQLVSITSNWPSNIIRKGKGTKQRL